MVRRHLTSERSIIYKHVAELFLLSALVSSLSSQLVYPSHIELTDREVSTLTGNKKKNSTLEVKSWFRTFTVLALPPVGRTVEQKSFFLFLKGRILKLVIFFIAEE